MIKSWLIKTEAPYAGTEQYYRAYSKTNPLEIDEVNTWFWEEETMDLWGMYGFRWEDEFEDEYEEVKDDYDSFEDFVEAKLQEWQEDCSIECRECNEEDFHMYVPGGEGELDIIYDERNDTTDN